VALCMQACCGTTFAGSKIVFVVDQVSHATMKSIHQRLIKERVVSDEEVVHLNVDDKFDSESGAAIQLKRIAPLVVIVPDFNILGVVGKLGLTAKAVFITHGPWASGGDDVLLENFPMMAVRVSTFLDADAACLDWLMLVAPSISHIGIVASTDSSPRHMQKVEREFERKIPTATGFLVASINEAVALVATSKARKIDAWYFPHTPIVWGGPQKILHLVNELKIPAAFEYSHVYSQSGGLMSCSSQFDLVQRVVDAVKYLLASGNGSQPIDFRPTTMSVAINLDTAKTIGLSLPQKLMRRFDHRFTKSELTNGKKVPLAENSQ
jgi:hypothetical protein